MNGYYCRFGISPEEVVACLKKTYAYSFMQLPEWSKVKDYWRSELCGIYKDDEMIGCASMLVRDLPLGIKMIYIPRGPVMDFSDTEAVAAFTRDVKAYAKKVHAFMVEMDPNVINENWEGQDTKTFGNSFEQTIAVLKENGYVHKGLSREVNAYSQPRYHMAVPLFNENGIMTKEEFVASIPKKMKRYYANDFHKKRGVEVVRVKGKHDLDTFCHVINQTEDRKNINLRNREYFERICDTFGEKVVFYYAMVDMDRYMEFLKEQIAEQEHIVATRVKKGEAPEKIIHFNKKLDEARAIKEEHGKDICLAVSCVHMPDEDDIFKMAEPMYAGSDISLLSDLHAPTAVIYEGCLDSIELGCWYYNMGGTSGDPSFPLTRFKQGFEPHIFDFVGEFDLVVNRFLYVNYVKFLPAVKSFIHKIGRKG